MSSITFTRTAARRVAQQQLLRRQFAVVPRRTFFGNGTRSQPTDWGRQAKRIYGNAIFYFPFLTIVFGWPYAAKLMCDGRM